MEAKNLTQSIVTGQEKEYMIVYVEIISREDRNTKRQITSFQKNNKGQ